MTFRVRSKCRRWRGVAFTLIELIVVLSLLVVVASLVAPRLAEFFRGRDISNEGRRFLSLTMHAQDQAVSAGIPMTLWIDLLGGRYGLRDAPGWPGSVLATNRGRIYELSGSLRFSREMLRELEGEELQIRFLPDGWIDEGSVSNVLIELPERELLWIARSTNTMGYEIRESQRIK